MQNLSGLDRLLAAVQRAVQTLSGRSIASRPYPPLNAAGTTVAATMFLAHQAGIRLFATGGIGGAHQGREHSWDISADLL